MAAYKVSNKDIEHVLSGAEHCERENRFVDSFIQSELIEVRLELKSVKEIVNILNRDLATFNVRVHSLQEHK